MAHAESANDRTPASTQAPADRRVDFTRPEGEAALLAPDSVSWRVFKNPIATYIGGITAVILELAEPRVCAGVWDHTTFRTEPLKRLRRTGLAAMVTVYGPRSTAERMIAGVRRMHGRVEGVAADGRAYNANDTALLDWVQATASYGFVEAYAAHVRALTDADRDAFYAESAVPAGLYGATGAPKSLAGMREQFAAMRPSLKATGIIFEFLELMQRTPILPGPMRPLQRVLTRAAVDIRPEWAFSDLGIGPEWRIGRFERGIATAMGKAADRLIARGSPAVQACRRVGLPDDHLYRPGFALRLPG